MSKAIGTWVKVQAVTHVHPEIVGVIVAIPAHAPDTMVTVRYSSVDYRGWPITSDKWIFLRDIVASGAAAFEA